MVYLRTAVSFLLLSSFFAGVACWGGEIHTNMAGNVACASFLKARAERSSLPFELWLSGYLTGLATYDRRINDVAKLNLANGSVGTLLLESYCKTHPQESYQIAAREMARSVFYTELR